MSSKKSNVTSFPTSAPTAPAPSGGGGGGRDVDSRLYEVERDIIKIKEKLNHLATKEDIKQMQLDMMKWAIGILIPVFAIFVAVLGYVISNLING